MKIDGADMVQMRDGSFYVAPITTPNITVEVAGLAKPIKIPKDKIAWIIFHNPYGYPQDRVQLTTGSEIRGNVTNATLRLQSDDLGKLELQTSKILTAQFTSNHDLDPG